MEDAEKLIIRCIENIENTEREMNEKKEDVYKHLRDNGDCCSIFGRKILLLLTEKIIIIGKRERILNG
jgi:uncharacterized protein (UPF0335 family)